MPDACLQILIAFHEFLHFEVVQFLQGMHVNWDHLGHHQFLLNQLYQQSERKAVHVLWVQTYSYAFASVSGRLPHEQGYKFNGHWPTQMCLISKYSSHTCLVGLFYNMMEKGCSLAWHMVHLRCLCPSLFVTPPTPWRHQSWPSTAYIHM